MIGEGHGLAFGPGRIGAGGRAGLGLRVPHAQVPEDQGRFDLYRKPSLGCTQQRHCVAKTVMLVTFSFPLPFADNQPAILLSSASNNEKGQYSHEA